MNLLYFVIIIPLLTFIVLSCMGRHWSKENISVVGVSALGLVLLLLLLVSADFYQNQQVDKILIFTQPLWQWFSVGKFHVVIALLLDGLSLTFLLTVTLIALLVHIYTINTLDHRQAYTFYAYGSLMFACMALLLLADNLLAMLLGWQGLTLCSYLLVGFNHKQFRSSFAAVRTFIVMHISDICLLIGIFLLYGECQTLNIRELLMHVNEQLAAGSEVIWWITMLLFMGVIGKVALLPLHVWVTDTVVAPMPAIALINSASTMLAGTYLLLRLNSLFIMNSDIFEVIGFLAAVTMLYASCSALVQNDIKRLMTYATLSQFSYVFLAISVQAWMLALVYLISYATVSALLLLIAAAMIRAGNGERNIVRMGGLVKHYPLLFILLIASAVILCVMPWVSMSFYDKGNIIWALVERDHLGLAAIALIGLLLSILYLFRLVFTIWHHRDRAMQKQGSVGQSNYLSLIVLLMLLLAFLTVLPFPPVEGILPGFELQQSGWLPFQLLLAAITVLGILISYVLYAGKNLEIQEIAHSPLAKSVAQLWYSGWRIDQLYNWLIIRPYRLLTQRLSRDPLSLWSNWLPNWVERLSSRLTVVEDGQLRWYIASIVMGGIAILLLLIFI